jgi:hypothetical protein
MNKSRPQADVASLGAATVGRETRERCACVNGRAAPAPDPGKLVPALGIF